MTRTFVLVAAIAFAGVPLSVRAQGPTQGRDGLASGTQTMTGTASTPNSLPAGSSNAETGPQSRPAYPSGSTTANPGEAFVRTTPVPATGPAQSSPGALTTTTVTAGAPQTRTRGPGVGEAATPPK
jgi:hypothetical protein